MVHFILRVDGIIVSNHGARQLDSCNATVRVLPEVVDAVGADVPVFLDGGVRSGRDAFKARHDTRTRMHVIAVGSLFTLS